MNSKVIQKTAARAGILAPILFTILVAVESLLRPGYSQIYNNVSDLGIGSYAIIQNANFIVFGILLIVFAIGFGDSLPSTQKTSKQLAWLITIFAIGIMFAGITLLLIGAFSEDPMLAAHALASFVAFFAIIGAQLLTWRALKESNEATWERYGRYSLVSGLLSLLLLVAFSYTSSVAYHGATERAFIAVWMIWIIVSGLKLVSLQRAQNKVTNQ